MTITIYEDELIVGNQARGRRSAPLFPENAVDWILDQMDTFPTRMGDRFNISEEEKQILRRVLPYWRGKSLRDKVRGSLPPFMRVLCLASLVVGFAGGIGVPAQDGWPAFEDGRVSWKASGPLLGVGPGVSASDPHVAIKDPTVVLHNGAWHLFATLRMKSGRVDIQYLRFTDWTLANQAPRHLLALHDQYYCAPQVFYFRPHRKWYLVYQLADKARQASFGPFYSTSDNVGEPYSWTKPQPMVTKIR